MVIRKVFFILLLGFISACAPKRYIVTGGEGMFGEVKLEYLDYQALDEQEFKNSQTMLRPYAPENLPKGGRIIIHIETSTLDHSNLDVWTFALYDEKGIERIKKKGQFDVPKYNLNRWWNLTLIDVPFTISDHAVVRVFDHVMNKRHDFIITKNKEIN